MNEIQDKNTINSHRRNLMFCVLFFAVLILLPDPCYQDYPHYALFLLSNLTTWPWGLLYIGSNALLMLIPITVVYNLKIKYYPIVYSLVSLVFGWNSRMYTPVEMLTTGAISFCCMVIVHEALLVSKNRTSRKSKLTTNEVDFIFTKKPR